MFLPLRQRLFAMRPQEVYGFTVRPPEPDDPEAAVAEYPLMAASVSTWPRQKADTPAREGQRTHFLRGCQADRRVGAAPTSTVQQRPGYCVLETIVAPEQASHDAMEDSGCQSGETRHNDP